MDALEKQLLEIKNGAIAKLQADLQATAYLLGQTMAELEHVKSQLAAEALRADRAESMSRSAKKGEREYLGRLLEIHEILGDALPAPDNAGTTVELARAAAASLEALWMHAGGEFPIAD